ncbi:hypothetical protein [Microvirga alba]|uniref:Uncharacterized protein n=1 Tax=Microvirga alba TaxID=2791025 RepID=A0A931BVK7_9HYPH|nr:hypothetical protein [Microvirga alba]MBF9234655.1 hypothetical protein [Microvirga alba]
MASEKTKKPRGERGLRSNWDSRHRARAAGAFDKRRRMISVLFMAVSMLPKFFAVNNPVERGQTKRAARGPPFRKDKFDA